MYCTVIFDSNDYTFSLESDIPYDDVTSFIVEWIKTDIHEAPDDREIPQKDVYWISIYKSNDGWYEIEDNCESRDLRRGVLGYFINNYKIIRNRMEYLGNIEDTKENQKWV